MIFNTLVLAALASYTLASPVSPARVVHEKRYVSNSIKGERVHPDAIIPIRIALKQSNLEHGYDAVMDVSDPASPNYGKHWTVEEVREFFAPPTENVEAVKAWLIASGIASEIIGESEDKGWIGINVPASQAEDLLAAEYHEHYSQDKNMRLGCDEYSLPSHISELVDYIKPGVSFSPPIQKRDVMPRAVAPSIQDAVRHSHGPAKAAPSNGGNTGNSSDLADCGISISPDCIRALYDIPQGQLNQAANNLGVAEFTPDAYSQKDLNLFFKNQAPYVPQGTHPNLYSIDGGKAPVPTNQAGGESDVDFDIVISLVYPQQTVLYQVGTVNFNGFSEKQAEAELTFLTPLLDGIDGSFCTKADKKNGLQCGVAPIPKVLSVSYGSAEVFNFQAAVVRTCQEIMKLSLQGTTVIFASGDYGVAALPDNKYNGCVNPDYTFGDSGKIFSPDFPSDCPYVLSVGATELFQGETVDDPESVMLVPQFNTKSGATFSSGGGFSNYFPRPSYQESAVSTYLNNYVPPYKYYTYNGNDIFSGNSNIGANGGVYNRAGRGFPDVSANGVNFTAWIDGAEHLVYGTSLAAPIWASVITLINQQRTKAGQPSVGFVQPVLYKNPQAFHDITEGDNPGCGTNGFPAVKGWDPSTGLGTPDFPALLKIFKTAAGGSGGGSGGSPPSYPGGK